MKNLIYFAIVLLMIGCSGKESDKSGSENATMEWLTLSGEEDKPKIVLISGDEEYRSEEALPMLARILSEHHGFNCIVLFAQDPEYPGVINPNYLNHIPGLEHLEDADLMVMFTRFRALPDDEMKYIDDFLKSGKPVIGIRTATHAFDFRDTTFESSFRHYSNFYNGDDQWKDGFGRAILGEKWISHHGNHRYQSTRGLAAPGEDDHPILNGIQDGEIWGPSDVYGVRLPLPGDSNPIVLGQVINSTQPYNENDIYYGLRPTDSVPATEKVIRNRNTGEERVINPNDPMMPIAWVKSYQIPGGEQGRVFTSTIGASTDLVNEATRRLIINSVYWLLDLEVPPRANVEFVGDYQPSAFDFKNEDYWVNKNLRVTDLD